MKVKDNAESVSVIKIHNSSSQFFSLDKRRLIHLSFFVLCRVCLRVCVCVFLTHARATFFPSRYRVHGEKWCGSSSRVCGVCTCVKYYRRSERRIRARPPLQNPQKEIRFDYDRVLTAGASATLSVRTYILGAFNKPRGLHSSKILHPSRYH